MEVYINKGNISSPHSGKSSRDPTVNLLATNNQKVKNLGFACIFLSSLFLM